MEALYEEVIEYQWVLRSPVAPSELHGSESWILNDRERKKNGGIFQYKIFKVGSWGEFYGEDYKRGQWRTFSA